MGRGEVVGAKGIKYVVTLKNSIKKYQAIKINKHSRKKKKGKDLRHKSTKHT